MKALNLRAAFLNLKGSIIVVGGLASFASLILASCSYYEDKRNGLADPRGNPAPSGKIETGFAQVNEILFVPACVRCHNVGNRQGGAALDTFQEVVAKIGRVRARIHDTVDPMPPDGPLSAMQLNALAVWIEAGMPEETVVVSGPEQRPEPEPNPEPEPDPEPESEPEPEPEPNLTFAQVNAQIFEPKCAGCHSGEGASAGIRVDSYEAVTTNIEDHLFVIENNIMPPRRIGALPDDLKGILQKWVEQGMPR